MTIAAVRNLRNALDVIQSEHLSRPPPASRDDLIERTRALGQEALAINIPQFAAVAGLRRAEMQIALERWDDALASLHVARRHIDSLAAHEHGVFLLRMEAQAYAGLGQWESVRRVCADGIAIVEPSRERISPLTLQSSYLRFRIGLYELAVRAEIEAGDVDAALRVAELVKCRSLSRSAGVRQSSGDTGLIAAYRKVCEQIDQVIAAGGQTEQLLAKRRSLWHLIQISRVAQHDQTDDPVSLQQLQAVLATDEAVVSYFWMDPSRLLVTAFDRDQIRWSTVRIDADQRTRLTELARALQDARPPNSAAQLPGSLSDCLFPNRIRDVLRHKKRIALSPHRVLHALPLHALPWGEGYLLETFAIRYIPNLSTLLRRVTPSAQSARVLSVGVSHSQVPPANDFRPLKDADGEVRDMLALYGEHRCQPFLERTATETALMRLNTSGDIKRFGVLHFACHGINIDSDNPMESKLFLSDSALDGLDIATWEIKAQLVVLSACCSGQRPVRGRGMDELPGDDLFGLQAAFFAAGACQILSSMWPVDSATARTIALAFHSRLDAGAAADIALQAAIVEFLDDARRNKDLKRQRPYTWAPFFLTASARVASAD